MVWQFLNVSSSIKVLRPYVTMMGIIISSRHIAHTLQLCRHRFAPLGINAPGTPAVLLVFLAELGRHRITAGIQNARRIPQAVSSGHFGSPGAFSGNRAHIDTKPE